MPDLQIHLRRVIHHPFREGKAFIELPFKKERFVNSCRSVYKILSYKVKRIFVAFFVVGLLCLFK